jgi:hypothetical protein
MILLVCNKKARNCSYLTTISDFLMLVIFEGLHGQNRIGGNAIADIIIYGRQAGTQSQ